MNGTVWSNPAFEGLAQLLGHSMGLDFGPNRHGSAEAGMRRAMARSGIAEPAEYLRLLEQQQIAQDDLISELTVGETYFFREPAHWAFLRSTVLPELRKSKGDDQVYRVWSAGCATGEEAYSLAILFHEAGLAGRTSIRATDLSRNALAKARQGRYRRWSLRGLEPSVIDRYFRPAGEHWVLDEAIRRAVSFDFLNLACNDYPSLARGIWDMDLILCRNVMIYFNPSTIRHVAERLIGALASQGWLILSSTDPPLSRGATWRPVPTPAGVFYRRAQAVPGLAKPRVDAGAAVTRPIMFPAPDTAAPASAPVLAAPVAPPPPASATAKGDSRAPAGPVAATTSPLPEAEQAMASGDYGRAAALASELPDDARARALHVRALANLGDPVAARQAAAEAVLRHPLSAELHLLQAAFHVDDGALREAARAVRRALYLDRRYALAHFMLGSVLARLDDSVGSRRAYRNTIALCRALPKDELLPHSEGQRAGWLAEAAQVQLAFQETEP